MTTRIADRKTTEELLRQLVSRSVGSYTFCNPMDRNLPDSSVCAIFPARILEWVAISFARGST